MIWKRYFFREIFKVFAFFLLTFFFLYALLDYSTHMDDFFLDHKLQFTDLLRYYLDHFIKRVPLLVPLSFLIATIKVLTTLNLRREWVVLQTAGIKTRTLFRPFFWFALACSLFSFFNYQYLLPVALADIDNFHAAHFKHSHRAKRKELIHLLNLKDNTKLIYQKYNAEKDALFDVLWVRSPNDIWRMKYLSANPSTPTATYVDHLVRNKDGFLEKFESYDQFTFEDLKWRPSMTGKSFIPFESRSIKELYRLLFFTPTTTAYESPKILTQLCFKLAMPLLPFLVILGLAPYCTRFSRKSNIFLIYCLGMFTFIVFYVLMDAAVVLGEHSVLSPFLAIFTPFIAITTIFSWKYLRYEN